ncbi:aminopeptidase [Marilutibacter chinensis]|uniref:Aminopeptidase n=1 Tax=Marilutibacter chinensis TaxID=2912247 RepID=A0ABS9HVT2_9GAMM|nr:aminopeptidase [Lysobacter chinensis]MCF7222257.1 aminopeptidase [Lysobacter chinensis]
MKPPRVPASMAIPVAVLSVALLAAMAGCRPAGPDGTLDGAAEAEAEAPPPAAEVPVPAPSTDLEQLAGRIINDSAGVVRGEIVWIAGRPHDAELLENLAVQARRIGAYPLVEYSSDRLSRRLFFDVPAEFDSIPNAAGLMVANNADVLIEVSNGTSENLFEGADPARIAARIKADEEVQNAFMKRGGRLVEIGNGLYPTPWRAERFGLSEAALAQMFWESVNVDYAALQQRGDAVRAAMADADQVHVTHPNGTDLTVSVKGRAVMVSDGAISAEEKQQGGGAQMTYLPAGEVYAAAVPGSANGKLVQSHGYYQGKPIENMTLTFENGELTSVTGDGEGFAAMKAVYDAIDDDRKNRFGFVDLGINPNVRLPAESRVGNWVPAGTVSLGSGNNTWAGGDNSVPHSFSVSLQGATVSFDGNTVVENGELKL